MFGLATKKTLHTPFHTRQKVQLQSRANGNENEKLIDPSNEYEERDVHANGPGGGDYCKGIFFSLFHNVYICCLTNTVDFEVCLGGRSRERSQARTRLISS